jgi:LmbE family N-acetylglucosaminyl deacetylase
VTDDPSGYDTLFKGPADRRLRRVLVIATTARELTRHCDGTLAVLRERGVHVGLLVVTGPDSTLGFTPLALPAEAELRDALVERIRAERPDVVVAPDPTPMLRQHPDQRRVARCALDAAWPYAGAGGPKEAWVYGGPAPDLFVDRADGGEERFAQVDFRER